jgi:hypothetical protein
VLLLVKCIVQVSVAHPNSSNLLIGKKFIESTIGFAHNYTQNDVVFRNRDQVFCYIGGNPVGYK